MTNFRRRRGPKNIAALLPRITREAFNKRGFAGPDIHGRWPLIVGETLATHTAPQRMIYPKSKGAGAVLVIRAEPAWSVAIQHQAPLIVERINAFHGYGAVADIRIVQGPVKTKKTEEKKPLRTLDATEENELRRSLNDVGDAELQDALLALGRALKEREAK